MQLTSRSVLSDPLEDLEGFPSLPFLPRKVEDMKSGKKGAREDVKAATARVLDEEGTCACVCVCACKRE